MIAPGALFGREVRLTVDGFELSGLACRFRVKKTLKPEPNTLDLEIMNLAPETRAKLQAPKSGKLAVRLEAGYQHAGLTQIYFGEVRAAWSRIEGADVITALAAGDGEASLRARVHVPVGAKTPPDQALRAIAKALGVKSGNVESAARTLRQRGKALFPSPGAISGNAARELSDFCRASGLEWSIQNDALQVLEKGKATPDTAFVLSSGRLPGDVNTGLIGSPSADSKGIVNARCALLPDLRPGRIVVFQSEVLTGAYRLEEVEYVGETHGSSWYADIACKKW